MFLLLVSLISLYLLPIRGLLTHFPLPLFWGNFSLLLRFLIRILKLGLWVLAKSNIWVGFVSTFFRSKLAGERRSVSFSRIRMEASSKMVPSIVVYVTVPNKELGLSLLLLFDFCLILLWFWHFILLSWWLLFFLLMLY